MIGHHYYVYLCVGEKISPEFYADGDGGKNKIPDARTHIFIYLWRKSTIQNRGIWSAR